MILLADSGSTKCDWLLLNSDWEIISHIKTMGLNPYFHNEIKIGEVIAKNAEFKAIASNVSAVYFYGAGCSSDYYNEIMLNGISSVFVNAEISVNHDLKACALASYTGKPIISCILGTGSNSCFYDGKVLKGGNPSLGFIVGDEASGNYFGKLLLNDYFYGNLPVNVAKEFEEVYNLTFADFTNKVYNNKSANVFLASFMSFIAERKEYPYFQNMLLKGIKIFMQKHVCCFENYQNYDTHFIGSIGFYFQEEIEQVALELDINIGGFIQKPIFNLVDYHKRTAVSRIKS